jgi:hypothetical protein
MGIHVVIVPTHREQVRSCNPLEASKESMARGREV